ncbi:elongator complex protein 5 [Heptranchias perlo]|uniref:elongator complex protein 5 n=1 Tax=Heptranchias perlo TaxID=212740 RepID=UPI00355A4031
MDRMLQRGSHVFSGISRPPDYALSRPSSSGPGSGRASGLLQSLSGGSEPAGLLLIADSLECEGRSLLKSFVTSAALREEPVHVFSFELSESEFSTGLDDGVRARLQFHDGFSDPLNWEKCGTFTVDRFTARDLLASVSPPPGGAVLPCTVVLDSLSWILQQKQVVFLCRVLQEFQRGATRAELKIRKVVGLLHADLHQPEVVEAICQLASTVVTLTPLPESCGLRMDFPPYASATIVHKRKSGKVLKKEEYFTVEDRFTLRTSVEPIQRQETGGGGDVQVVDPAANLTFNLRLTDKERRTKESLTLPYHFSTEKKTNMLQSGVGEGKIYYEPDAGDDIDEEDPDDDLDI